MRLQIRARNLEITRELNKFIGERLTRALNRFEDRIRRTSVLIADINGPRGGLDKTLRISVLLSGSDRVVLTAFGSDLQLMVDKAAARIKLRVSSAIAKARHFDRRERIRQGLVR